MKRVNYLQDNPFSVGPSWNLSKVAVLIVASWLDWLGVTMFCHEASDTQPESEVAWVTKREEKKNQKKINQKITTRVTKS